MRYVGSKNRLSKELAPIIQSYITDETVTYIEPFVGGANMIDKINHHNKIGSDLHKQLIALLNKAKYDKDSIPDRISLGYHQKVKRNQSDYPDWEVGLIGFCSCFGADFMKGYARNKKGDNSGAWSAGAIKNLKKQSELFKDITFECKSFQDYNPADYKNCVFYLDPPYREVYGYSTGKFPYEEFDKWAIELAKNNTVLISEYQMPEDKFECIWSKDVKVRLTDKGYIENNKRVEKLFKVR